MLYVMELYAMIPLISNLYLFTVFCYEYNNRKDAIINELNKFQ